MALPFANMIVIALAIPYALRSGAHARAQNFSYALGSAFLYWGTTSICQSFGEHGQMPAWLAAWMAIYSEPASAAERKISSAGQIGWLDALRSRQTWGFVPR